MLYALKEDNRSWAAADKIIENCKDPRSIFFGLIVGAAELGSRIAAGRNGPAEMDGDSPGAARVR